MGTAFHCKLTVWLFCSSRNSCTQTAVHVCCTPAPPPTPRPPIVPTKPTSLDFKNPVCHQSSSCLARATLGGCLFGAVQDGCVCVIWKGRLCSTPSLSNFASVALETVARLVWLWTVVLSHPFQSDECLCIIFFSHMRVFVLSFSGWMSVSVLSFQVR